MTHKPLARFSIVFSLMIFSLGFVKPRSVNLEDPPRVERWGVKSAGEKKKKLNSAKNFLVKAGLSHSVENWEDCWRFARQAPSASLIRDWTLLLELRCAKKLADGDIKIKKSGQTPGTILKESIARMKSLTERATNLEERINSLLLTSQLSLCQWLAKHSQWKDLRIEIQKLFKQEFQMAKADHAQLYFLAGELLVAERHWSDAYWQFSRAQDISPDPLNDARLKNILPMVPQSLRDQYESRKNGPVETPLPPVVPSNEETEFFAQAQNSLIRNEPVAAVEAFGKLLKKYPNGVKAKWAQDKIFELLVGEIEKSRGPSGSSVARKRIETEMAGFDFERQSDWGKALFDMQAYSDAAPLLLKAAEQTSGTVKSSKYFYLAARAFHLSGGDSDAKEIYRRIIRNYPMALEFIDSSIQWALININENDPAEGITHLEMARSRKMTNQQDLTSLFWLYQCYKMKKADASVQQTGSDLIRRFPLTYYGLIAFQDLNKQLPSFEKQKSKSAKVYFSEGEWKVLERARALLVSGFLDEAVEELSVVTNRPLSIDESQYLASFYVQSLHYQKTFNLLSGILDEDPTRKNDFLIHQLFPQEYWDLVSDEKKRSGLDPLLLLSVMRQESAFDHEVVSRSGAIGLLQMIPPTAEEVKKETNSNAQIPKDLFDPGTNVKFCAHYLSHMIKKYNGSIPLALAAYNAGPTRITQFLNSQGGSLKDTWVDELPWSETSFYVKSILKNYIVYRILYEGLTQLPSPPWLDSQKSVQK